MTLLPKIPIYARDGEAYFKYGVVDWLDSGEGVMVYIGHSGQKISRHRDGRTYGRVVGSGEQASPAVRVPFSQIRKETVYFEPIPSDLTFRTHPFAGPPPTSALTFSSTAFQTGAYFAAEVVDQSELAPTLAAWESHELYLSTQTWHSNASGKVLLLSVLNRR